MKHILIVGGGVIGLSIAYYTIKRGHRVTILERGAPNHDMASLGNSGIVCPSHFVPLATPSNVKFGLRNLLNPESPFYIRPRVDGGLIGWGLKFMQAANPAQIAKAEIVLRDMSFASRKCYEELADEQNNDFGLQKKGLLMLCNTEQGFHHEVEFAKHANELGVEANAMDASEVAKLQPNVTMNIAGGVHFPQDCHLSPMKFIAGLTKWLLDNGATICWNTNITGWATTPSKRPVIHSSISSDGRRFEADEYVIAGGAWSNEIAHSLNVSLPMQGGKGYSLTLSNPREMPTVCAILVEARAAVTPMGDALRVGGTMEIAGLDNSINPRRVQGVVKSACRYYTAFTPEDFKDVPVWRGLRPVSPDGLPYVGRFKQYKNVSVAAGHAMLGLSLGPITGKLMCEILSDEHPSLNLTMLNPDRYS
jgi:D-amino-acid dehydrogenase